MLSSVAAELATPTLVARFGYRAVFGAGLILLGAPALLLPVSTELAIVLAICVLRGLGFGITVVVGAALAARLAPAERRELNYVTHGTRQRRQIMTHMTTTAAVGTR